MCASMGRWIDGLRIDGSKCYCWELGLVILAPWDVFMRSGLLCCDSRVAFWRPGIAWAPPNKTRRNYLSWCLPEWTSTRTNQWILGCETVVPFVVLHGWNKSKAWELERQHRPKSSLSLRQLSTVTCTSCPRKKVKQLTVPKPPLSYFLESKTHISVGCPKLAEAASQVSYKLTTIHVNLKTKLICSEPLNHI
jgi:hypothetical protein